MSDYEEETAYTMTWTATSSNPALGDGSLTARYVRIGNQVTVTARLVCGSTTTFGSGTYMFSLPYPAAGNTGTYATSMTYHGPCRFIDSGTAFYFGHVICHTYPGAAFQGDDHVYIQNGNSTFQELAHDTPFTVAQGDTVEFTLTYIRQEP